MSPHVMTWQTIRLFLVPVKMSQLIGGTERRAELISRSVCVCERYAEEQLIWDRSFRILMVQLGAEITMPATVGITGTFLYALHPDNSLVEYVEWSDETKRKIFGEH